MRAISWTKGWILPWSHLRESSGARLPAAPSRCSASQSQNEVRELLLERIPRWVPSSSKGDVDDSSRHHPADEPVRRLLARSEAPAFAPFPLDPPEVEQALDSTSHLGRFAKKRRFPKQHSKQPTLREHAVDDLGDHEPQRRVDVLAPRGGECDTQPMAECLQTAMAQDGEHRLSVRKELVEGAYADPGFVGDPVRGRGPEAISLQNPSASLENRVEGGS